MATAVRDKPRVPERPARSGRGSAAVAAPALRIAPAPPAPTPEELAVSAQGGSVEAFGQLVQIFEVRLYNFLLRRLPAADAEDLTQETFIRAWQRIDRYSPRWRFSTWLFTIATRLATTHLRRGRDEVGLDAATGIGARFDAGASLARAEEQGRVWMLVGRVLNQEQQTAVWLRYVEDMAMQEIARVMGKSQVGVRVMLHRARATLAQAIEEAGFADQRFADQRVLDSAALRPEPCTGGVR